MNNKFEEIRGVLKEWFYKVRYLNLFILKFFKLIVILDRDNYCYF